MGRKIFAVFLTAAFLYIVSPLLFPLAMGGVFAVIFMPWVEWLEARKLATRIASAVVTLTVTLVILLPTSVLIYQGVKTGVEQLRSLREAPPQGADWAEALVNSPYIHRAVEWATTMFPVGVQELSGTLSDLFRSVSNKAAEWLGDLLTRLPGLAMALAVIVMSLYFFLVDGRKLILFVRRQSVFSPAQTSQLLHTLQGVCRSVILAAVVSGICQSLFETFMIFVTGTPNVLLIGIVVFVASFIPLVGTAPVTFGLAIQQFFLGRTAAAVVLLISAFFVTTMDNFIRPWFLRGRAHLHPLIAFAAAFGGLETLGFAGIFLGPIVAALLVATIQVMTETEPAQGPPAEIHL